ncbi:hypothetical protein LIER_00918 [Lithospermum erythrorhizon]|uniref:Uncharacterized protein n=1 Tax=Lithospermum erythrorhizon TaxID=34254 RepID=A0AAV3NJK7_LITER
MPSYMPNYHPYYGSMMQYSSQPPPYNPYMPLGNENVLNSGTTEIPKFSTQIDLGSMSGVNEETPIAEDSTIP